MMMMMMMSNAMSSSKQKESFQPGVFQSLCSLPNVDVKGELVTFDKHSLALDMFFLWSQFLFPLCVSDDSLPQIGIITCLISTNDFARPVVHGAGEDAFKAVGIAAVMEKAGCPIPPDLQELVERSLGKPYGLHQVLTGKNSLPEVVGLWRLSGLSLKKWCGSKHYPLPIW